jgi:hypothetical protein
MELHAKGGTQFLIGQLLSFVYILVGWHTSSVSLPPGDVILAQLACPQNDVIFCLQQTSVVLEVA